MMIVMTRVLLAQDQMALGAHHPVVVMMIAGEILALLAQHQLQLQHLAQGHHLKRLHLPRHHLKRLCRHHLMNLLQLLRRQPQVRQLVLQQHVLFTPTTPTIAVDSLTIVVCNVGPVSVYVE